MKIIPIKIIRQQSDHTCGPAVLQMFLHHYNIDKQYTEAQLTQLLNTCPFKGTKFEVIAAYLWSQGVNVISERSDSNINVTDIIDAGHIILTEWIDWGGHFVIICGYDHTHYCLADPEEDEIKVVEQDRFHSMWFTKQESFANMLYLSI